MAVVLRGLSAQIESMQKAIDSQHATICQINRTSQGQLKEIRDLKRMLKKKDQENEELRRRLSKSEGLPKNFGNSSTAASANTSACPLNSYLIRNGWLMILKSENSLFLHFLFFSVLIFLFSAFLKASNP